MTKDLDVEVPGEKAPEPAIAEAPDVSEAAQNARKDAQLAKEVAAVQELGSTGALDWSHLTQAKAAAGEAPQLVDPNAGLPDESEIDPAEITEPKLSRQGWVLPLNDPRARFAGR